jgi:hypothetical protein
VVRLVTIAVALAALAIPARAFAGTPVTSGVIRVNASVATVQIGLTRTTVLSRLGDPIDRYSRDDWGWDGPMTQFSVTFDHHRVVRVAIGGNGLFCIRPGVCTGSRGGVGYLKRRYGSKLRFFKVEDGTRAAIIVGKHGKRRVFTIFGVTSTKPAGRFRSILMGDCDRGVSRPC